MSKTYERPFVTTLAQRFAAERPLIQVLAGPRQVCKTTGVRQLMAQGAWPHHYANADDVLVSDRNWLLENWQQALNWCNNQGRCFVGVRGAGRHGLLRSSQ